ncbi:MAG: transposase family protein [Candidatus Caldatribacteriota bacterium]|nr:transposase family protein [Candidatus Caldatribacteriota bacterium]
MDICRAFKNNRLMKALTGLTIQEFNNILITFEKLLYEKAIYKKRKRKPGGGRKGELKTAKHKLFFILFYLKVYPTMDLAGFIFRVDKGQPCRWVQKNLPILEQALERECVLPARKINSIEEFTRLFPNVKEILIDVTERRTQRPKNSKQQSRMYSGKKKCHTRKNTIISDKKKILVVSPTKNGKPHDKKLLDKEGGLENIPPLIDILVDKGYQGLDKDNKNGNNIFIPKKKPKGGELTEEEKEENKIIATFRIPVEHAIGGMKRYGCLSNVYRNKNGIDDKFILVCAGLWNYHLRHTA